MKIFLILSVILLTVINFAISDGENSINGRISNGERATLGDFPHHVHLQIYFNTQTFICGGVYVSAKWILTAAHCVLNYEYIQAYIGVVDRIYGPMIHSIIIDNRDFVIIHPDYKPPSVLSNDLALIYVESGSDSWLNDTYVGKISMPIDKSEDFLGLTATATGFGRTNDADHSISQFLLSVNMTVISNDLCSVTYPGLITDAKICTSTTGGYSTCAGDNGGGLFITRNDERTLIGIGSFFADNCQTGLPAVFTRVANFVDWIDDNFENPPNGDRNCNCECICHTCPAAVRDEL